MSKLTDLELCKKIAEIEGEEQHVINKIERAFGAKKDAMWVVMHGDYYNPIEDWNITGPLMVKYEVKLVWECSPSYCHALIVKSQICESDSDEQRAICMAIVAKDEALK